MVLNKKKYQNVILYFCQMLGNELRGKKKLAKLLYFVDFDLYEKRQKSLTGETYKAFPMGPFPFRLEEIISSMSKEKSLLVKNIKEHNGYNATEIYSCLKEPDVSIFGKEEKQMLDRVIKKYGHLNGKQLEDLSHNEAPYIGTELRKEIPYELAFYRGTSFDDL